MKTNYALILAATLSTGVLVQMAYSDDQLPAGAATPTTPAAPKKKAAAAPKTAAAKKSAASEPAAPAVPLTPGPAIAKTPNVNVRGQAAINSEIVTHLKKGDRVTVLEEITLKKPKTDEPAKWAKIALPSSTAVWVHSSFIDPTNKTVIPKRLNLRSGPGENYSVIGRLDKGASIKEIESKGEWTKIEAPSQSFGYVAAHLLANDVGGTEIAAAPPKVATTPEAPAPTPPTTVTPPTEMVVTTPPAPVPATEPVMPTTTPTPAPPFPTPAAPATEPTSIAAPPVTPAAEPKEELVKRVITREGLVKRAVSIQSPSYFVLESLDTGKTVNYLYSTNVVLKDFRGQRIVVTGEEQLDERWPNTPVIYIDSLQAVP